MTLESFIWEKMPPFAAHPPDSFYPSLSAVFIAKTVKTCFRVVQSRVELEAETGPEVAAGRD